MPLVTFEQVVNQSPKKQVKLRAKIALRRANQRVLRKGRKQHLKSRRQIRPGVVCTAVVCGGATVARSKAAGLAGGSLREVELRQAGADRAEGRDDLVRARQQEEFAWIGRAVLQQVGIWIGIVDVDLNGIDRDADSLDVVARYLLTGIDR